MRRVFVRIELPTTPEGDYDDLHEAMRLGGYRRVIQGDTGQWWHLPHATYTKLSALSATRLRDIAVGRAKASHPKPRVFVDVANASAWSGLRRVTQSDPDPDQGK